MTAADIITNTIRRTSGSRPVATVTISRSSKLNSLNSHLVNLLTLEICNIPRTHPDLLAVILTGHDTTSFVGGADINEVSALDSPAAAREFITRVHLACKHPGLPCLEVAANCDSRVASRNAVFGMPEVNVGIPSVVEAALLPGLIGWGRTRRLLMLGDNISAVEALQWGLAEKVVEPDYFDQAVDEWIQLLERSGPRAVRRQKNLIRQWERLGLDSAIEAGIPAFGESFEKDEEGLHMLSEFFKNR
ncbi:ClpP/crotonase-like domain-containing protein [Aspergillus aurantiobrunneus]